MSRFPRKGEAQAQGLPDLNAHGEDAANQERIGPSVGMSALEHGISFTINSRYSACVNERLGLVIPGFAGRIELVEYDFPKRISGACRRASPLRDGDIA
jgi:hypothetical protein